MSRKTKRLRPSEIALFCTQTSLFLRAGVSLVEGLTLLRADIDSTALQEAIRVVSEEVDNRKPLAEAIRLSGAFPPYMERMAEIGERSGNLDDVLQTMAAFYEREGQLRQRIRSSVTYPILLIVMMSAIVLLLVVSVLPMFGDLLQAQGSELPGIARGLLGFGQFMGAYWWVLLLAAAAIFLAIALARRSGSGKTALDRFKANFIFTRSITRKISAERFSTAMAYLLRSNIDLDQSLALSGALMDNAYVSSKISDCRALIADGEEAPEAFTKTGIFPRLFSRMLAVGFKTGDLDGMMLRLSELYEQEVDTSLSRIIGAIEPTFVALLAIVVGVILVSVMMPLLDILSTIG
ncbi:MAG: type II secretion system F family protein [Oscillospiraceae bacterium]|nr:type II secretion system F family protein [Oscillospiraceae bacterium]